MNLSERLEAARREREGLIDLTAARPYATRNEADAAWAQQTLEVWRSARA